MGLLDGKVAIVTGGGNGIGREHCLALAAAGAKVVVNDLGQDRSGEGEATRIADKVVAEIEAAGGKAAANYDSVATVEGAANLIKTALDAFGRVDILVNNAGILRDKTLLKLTEDMWDPVIDVHLKGTYLCTRAAVEAMQAHGEGGRIISTSSLAGLKGNFGQTNYAAAKAGIYGMTRVWSMELARFGITANCIAPVALTRMTEDLGVIPEDMTPDKISPIVVFLASDLAKDINGRTFGVHGNEIFEYRMEQTPSLTRASGRWTPEEIAARLPELDAKPKPAAAGGSDIAAQVKGVFSALPKAYRADKAGDWKAVMQFEVGEAGVHTLSIADGKCSYSEGAASEPTCKVSFDKAETLVGMIKGTVKPEQAFMSGAMKASAMGDLMKFGKAFDFKEAAKLATAALGGGGDDSAASRPEDQIAVLFDHMGEAFVPERAGDWASILHFEVQGTGDWAVEIKDGKVRTATGKPGHADCTITFASGELFLDLAAGKVKPEQAFMAGKIKATNMAELMKFGKAFDLKRAADAMASGEVAAAAGGGRPEAAAPSGVNKACLGKRYRFPAAFAEPVHMVAYARATDDLNPRYLDEQAAGGLVASPLFAVRPAFAALMGVVSDPELNADLLNLVHGEQQMVFHDVIRPWDLLAPRATVTSIEDKSSGQLVKVKQTLLRDGDPVVEIESGLFIRDRSKSGGGGGGAKKPEAAQPEVAPEVLFTDTVTVAADQPLRYAEASLDKNPIHIDEKVARAAGHPSVILHGLCTMAFCQKAIVNHGAGGDPARLGRIKVRFSAVVLPGDTLTTRVWKVGEADGVTTYGFETVNQNGKKVISGGEAQVR